MERYIKVDVGFALPRCNHREQPRSTPHRHSAEFGAAEPVSLPCLFRTRVSEGRIIEKLSLAQRGQASSQGLAYPRDC